MKKILITILLLVAGSAIAAGPAKQKQLEEINYKNGFLKKVTVTLHPLNNLKEIDKVCVGLGVIKSKNGVILGCTLFNRKENRCTMFVMIPKYVQGHKIMAIMGHELLHCFAGPFHK